MKIQNMKEMTDQELTDKISQVFENFEDPGAARGWQELRKKYPENNRYILLWWGAAAAVLLIVGSLWFVLPDKNGTDEVASSIAIKQKDDAQITTEPDAAMQNEKRSESEGSIDRQNAAELVAVLPSKNSPSVNSSPIRNNIAGRPSPELGLNTIDKQQTVLVESVEVPTDPIQSVTQNIASTLLSQPIDPPIEGSNQLSARDSMVEISAKTLALAQTSPQADKLYPKVGKVSKSSKKANTEKSAFSFYAGSYINYSSGSETKLNFGAGFTSDIRLASNLKLSTGLALANNSLTYNDGKPASSKDNVAFRAVPGFGASFSGNNNLTTITRYDANLLALDIPVNLKYLIIPKDNKLYLMAGLSSGTYLAETYSLDYRNYSAAGSLVNQTQGLEEKKQLQTFDLARTLNISFGYSSNIGKNQNITIEPFLKYPLGGLGSEDLKFGSTGLNLKLNFSQIKKR